MERMSKLVRMLFKQKKPTKSLEFDEEKNTFYAVTDQGRIDYCPKCYINYHKATPLDMLESKTPILQCVRRCDSEYGDRLVLARRSGAFETVRMVKLGV